MTECKYVMISTAAGAVHAVALSVVGQFEIHTR